jgi:hypothetical protein
MRNEIPSLNTVHAVFQELTSYLELADIIHHKNAFSLILLQQMHKTNIRFNSLHSADSTKVSYHFFGYLFFCKVLCRNSLNLLQK